VFSQVCKKKDVAYLDPSDSEFDREHHILDIYYPKDTTSKKSVFIFVHGGSWNSGKKNTYRFLGKNLTKRGIITVIVNYRLTDVQYDKMGEDCARSVDWVYKNISKYGGDPEKITLGGHSAGGHLAALITLNSTFDKLQLKNSISKTVLIDAFGLNMHSYFNEYNNDYARSLFKVFTKDPEQWKLASPVYSVNSDVKTPFLVLTGSRTYPTIIKSSKEFCDKLKENGARTDCQVIDGKKHIGMISQLIFRKNKVYDILLDFMNNPK
jgi:acetyl esterase/lipase